MFTAMTDAAPSTSAVSTFMAMYATGLVPWVARAAAVPSIARAANASLNAPGLGAVMKRAAGIATNRPSPRFATRGGLRRSVKKGDMDDLRDRAPGSTSVVVWPDTFTEAFIPGAGADLIAAFSALGERVAVPSGWACCGRTLYDSGMLDLAKRSLRRLVRVLQPWTTAGVPVVVPEPSCLAAFRDELPALLPGDQGAARLASLARSPAEHLVASGRLQSLGAMRRGPATAPGRVVLHPHCHQRAVVGASADEAVLRALGYEVEVLDAGCCGLAGSFGFDARHEAVSRKIGAELWLPRVVEALGGPPGDGPAGTNRSESRSAGTYLVVDGFSCRTQLEHLSPELLSRVTNLAALLRRAVEPTGA